MDPIHWSILLGFIFLELSVAFIYFPYDTGMNFYKLKMGQVETAFAYDPVLGYSFKPNIQNSKPTAPLPRAPRRVMFVDVRTDENGFLFNESLSEAQKDHKLIFCLGGSSTAGTESTHDKHYPAVIDSMIKENGYRCVNTGVGGYRSVHELLMFKNKILKHKPAAVTIFSGYNDWEDYKSGTHAKNNRFRHCLSHVLPTNFVEQVIDYSALAHTAKRSLYKLIDKYKQLKKEPTQNSTDWTGQWRDNIGEIIDICNDNDIQCFLIGQLAPVYDNASWRAKVAANNYLDFNNCFDEYLEFVKLMNKTCKELSEEKKAIFVNVAEDFNNYFPIYLGDENHSKRYSLFTDRIHFSERGNMIMGMLILSTLSEHLS